MARLYRAGDEYSKSTEKLRFAVDELLKWIKANVPQDIMINLPLRCELYPSGEFLQRELSSFGINSAAPGKVKFAMTIGQAHSRRELFCFSEIIATGFLDQLSKMMEDESRQFVSAADKVTLFVGHNADKHASDVIKVS